MPRKYRSVASWVNARRRKWAKTKDLILAEPGNVARFGADMSRRLVPKDTFTLHNAITWKPTGRSKNNSVARMWVRALNNPKYTGRRARAPRYAAIHHKSGLGVPWQAKTGDPHWFFKTRKEVKRRFEKNVQGHIQKFI